MEYKKQINVEVLKSVLLRKKITRANFSLPFLQDDIHDLLLAAYMSEVEYRGKKFILDKETEDNISNFASFIANPKGKFGVVLSGMCGNGKTTLLNAFQSAINYLVDSCKLSRSYGITIVDAKELANYANKDEVFDNFKKKEYLAIEDVGREPSEIISYGNILTPLTDIIEYRYANMLFTVVTTNLTPKDFRDKYGNRIADRMNEMFFKIIFKNSSYRL